MRVSRSIEVRRPLLDVYRFLVVPENHLRFAPGLLEFRQTSPGAPWQVGGTALGSRRLLGRNVKEPVTFIENDGSSRLAFSGSVGPFPAVGRFVLSPTPGGTIIQVTAESRGRGIGRLAEPVLYLAGRRNLRQLAFRLKEILEAPDPEVTPAAGH